MPDFTARDTLFLKMADALFESELEDEILEVPAGGFRVLCDAVEREMTSATDYRQKWERADRMATRYAYIALGAAFIGGCGWLLLIAGWVR